MQRARMPLAHSLFLSLHLPFTKEEQMKKRSLSKDCFGKLLRILKDILKLALLVLEVLKKICDL